MTITLPSVGLELALLTLLVAVALCATTLLLVRAQLRKEQRRVAALEERLVTFVEASINVAHSVQQLQQGDDTLPRVEVHMPARRVLLQEAQARLEAGARVCEVAQPLGLSREEISLLRLRSG